MPGWYAEEMWGSVALYNPSINCQFFNVPVFQVTTVTDTSASFGFFLFSLLYTHLLAAVFPSELLESAVVRKL